MTRRGTGASVAAVSRRRRTQLEVVILVIAATGGIASANPLSVVPSAADVGDPLDLHARVDYAYSLEQSTLLRDRLGDSADPLAPIPRRPDLKFQQFRHTITPRAELGVYHDTWLSFALPIIVTQTRELSLADGVTRDRLSAVQDGILPASGFDARDPSVATSDNLMFRGPSRSGIDQVQLGLAVAPMNQQRDRTKPTWKLGAEVWLAAGKVARFNRNQVDDETGVGRGVHELKLWTSVAKQRGRFNAWFELDWRVPFATTEASQFDDPGFGASNTNPGQIAGLGFGVEAFALDDQLNGNRVSLDLGARVEGHFEGREYTELWEVFAFAGDPSFAGAPLVLDRDPTMDGRQALAHPGISNIENYLQSSARAAIRAELGPHARFALAVDLVWRTDHSITFADAGVDLPTCSTGASPCETDANSLVTPGTNEVNPLYVPGLDLVGHRFHSENNFGLVIGVEAQALF